MDGSAGRDEGVSICMRVCRRATLRATTALRCQHPKYPCHCRIDSRWQNDKCFCKTIWEVRMCLFFPSGDKIEDRELCLAALNMSTNTKIRLKRAENELYRPLDFIRMFCLCLCEQYKQYKQGVFDSLFILFTYLHANCIMYRNQLHCHYYIQRSTILNTIYEKILHALVAFSGFAFLFLSLMLFS